MSEVQKMVAVEVDDIELFKSTCDTVGVKYRQEPNRGDPITVAIFLVLGAAVAVSALQDTLDRHKGGQVIDLRQDAERPFYRSKDLAYGLLYLRASDGAVSLRTVPGGSSLDQLAKAVLSMRSGLLNVTKDEAVKQISGAIGDTNLAIAQEALVIPGAAEA